MASSGEIVLLHLIQADGVGKNRPALVLCTPPGRGDLLVCGISSQLRHYLENFDEIVAEGDPDYRSSGLIQPSLVRLGFLQAMVRSVIGSLSQERRHRLPGRLSRYLAENGAAS